MDRGPVNIISCDLFGLIDDAAGHFDVFPSIDRPPVPKLKRWAGRAMEPASSIRVKNERMLGKPANMPVWKHPTYIGGNEQKPAQQLGLGSQIADIPEILVQLQPSEIVPGITGLHKAQPGPHPKQPSAALKRWRVDGTQAAHHRLFNGAIDGPGSNRLDYSSDGSESLASDAAAKRRHNTVSNAADDRGTNTGAGLIAGSLSPEFEHFDWACAPHDVFGWRKPCGLIRETYPEYGGLAVGGGGRHTDFCPPCAMTMNEGYLLCR